MKQTVIKSAWIDSPKWTDGWPLIHNATLPKRPSVWLIDPEKADPLLNNRYTDLLNHDERSRASRFVQPAHQKRYKTTHAALRILLAQSIQANASSLCFETGHHHKPRLASHHNGPAFNISYTEGRSIIGLGIDPAIGVDIEWSHRDMIIDDMLPVCFSPNEINYINANRDERHLRFFTLWTRKEAILKLTGEGIGEHLPLFEVLDGECITEKHIIGGHPPDRIFLHSFLLGDRYIGCYASSTPLTALTIYHL